MRLLTYFFILISTLGCAQDNWVTLEKEDFSISYPSSLNIDDSGKEGTQFILTTDKDGEDDNFIENVNLSTQKVGAVTFDEYIKKMEREVSGIAKIIEKKKLEINGNKCYSLKMKATQNGVDAIFLQHFYIENQKAYVLTFSSEAKVYDDYYDEMNRVLRSFEIK
ncbi:hypothetical protein APR41_18165 [Salegentibacter salinarum]|uniref:PsbP C-terminal domain-containing protein n=1 Tax=Salegentibacter salinarum TaxID=447422 RepID=A0A2N0TTN4_9FLAO|nr:hypothetical protein [Salegentibacter salinarum]PKD18038.1 hypothetical protein APR41_18165 [Salegentibacter salinarum]SKB99334.1 hypothetical protein SAMN05660903_03693 [Salegentibacter salinarum]